MTNETAQVLHVFRNNVETIKAALKAYRGPSRHHYDCVYVWPKHWLAVRVNNDVCHAVAVDRATVVRSSDKRVFSNGNGERAILMDREKALCGALVHAVAILENFEKAVAA